MPRLEFDDDTTGTTAGALQIAIDIAEALPPPWDEVTGIVSTFADLFNFFFSPNDPAPSTSALVTIFQTLLVQEFTDNNINTQISNLNSLVNSFNGWTFNATEPIPPSLAEGLGGDNSEYSQFQEVYGALNDLINGFANGSLPALIDVITQMETSDVGTGDICNVDTNPQAAYLPIFAWGVTIYLLFAKFWISMAASANASSSVLSQNASMPIFNLTSANCLNQPPSQGWIAYAQAVSQSFQNSVAQRLQAVGPAISYYVAHNGTYYVYFQDAGEAVAGFNPESLSVTLTTYVDSKPTSTTVPWPGNVPLEDVWSETDNRYVVFAASTDNSQNETNAIAGLCGQYMALMQQTIYSNYFDPDDLAKTIQNWNYILQNNLQSFSPITPSD